MSAERWGRSVKDEALSRLILFKMAGQTDMLTLRASSMRTMGPPTLRAHLFPWHTRPAGHAQPVASRFCHGEVDQPVTNRSARHVLQHLGLILLLQYDHGDLLIDIDRANSLTGHPSFIRKGADDVAGAHPVPAASIDQQPHHRGLLVAVPRAPAPPLGVYRLAPVAPPPRRSRPSRSPPPPVPPRR